jgi:hypothetical protein
MRPPFEQIDAGDPAVIGGRLQGSRSEGSQTTAGRSLSRSCRPHGRPLSSTAAQRSTHATEEHRRHDRSAADAVAPSWRRRVRGWVDAVLALPVTMAA